MLLYIRLIISFGQQPITHTHIVAFTLYHQRKPAAHCIRERVFLTSLGGGECGGYMYVLATLLLDGRFTSLLPLIAVLIIIII